MTKSKIVLTASALLLAVGGVFATTMSSVETGHQFVPTNPDEQKCVPRKDCQTEVTPTVCRFISGPINVQLFEETAVDDCAVVLYEIQEP